MAPTRERDARGRFVKRTKPMNDENDFHHQTLRTYNRIADGGHEYDIEDARKREVWMNRSMKALWVILIGFLAWLLVGCKTKRTVEYVPVEKKVTRTVIVRDTIVDIQLIPSHDSVATRDSCSHLENAYAYSDAHISGGVLHHTLGTKAQTGMKAKVEKIIITRTDSIPYPVPGPTQYIEREFKSWEKLLMGVGAVTLLAAFGFVNRRLKKLISF